MKYRYEIYSQLNKYKNKDRLRLHMPGHKNSGEFKNLFPVAPLDVTELSFSDDLNCPTAAIKRAQNDIAEIVGAKRAYITTDGSSSGVFAMLCVASKFGNKIIVPRNSHKSVYNACRLFNLEPVIVQGAEYDGVLLPPDPELIERLVVNDVNIAGLIVTSPDYYGKVAPLEEYAVILKRHRRLLLCDGAHGAHLALDESRAYYCGVYADMWVDGAHKTLPALTQGAYVCINDVRLTGYVEEAMSMLRTTSPSYPVMASVEYGVKYYVNHPQEYARAKAAVKSFREEMKDFTLFPSADWTKLAIDFEPLGISPALAEKNLQKRGIYAEMNDGRYLIFYLSSAVTAKQLNELKNALVRIRSRRKLKGTYRQKPPVTAAERTYSYLYALRARAEWVPLDRAQGRMCAQNAGVTPPCMPVVVAGEIISPQAVAALRAAEKTFGIIDGKIKVVLL